MNAIKRIAIFLPFLVLIFSCERQYYEKSAQTSAVYSNENGGKIVFRNLPKSTALSSTTIDYFSSDDLDADSFEIADDGLPLTIEDYSPVGLLPRESSRPVIYAAFSHAMVLLADSGPPI